MPDLGKYAFAVLSSYGATITLLVVLVAASLWRAAAVRRQLDDVEKRRESTQNG